MWNDILIMAIWQTEPTGDHAKFLKIKNRVTSVFYSLQLSLYLYTTLKRFRQSRRGFLFQLFYLFRLSGPNPSGRSSFSVKISYWSLLVARIIWNSSGLQNSIITWRQTPHGAAYSFIILFIPPTTQIASNSITPSLTALKNAVLSAQLLGVYPAFSMLQPP